MTVGEGIALGLGLLVLGGVGYVAISTLQQSSAAAAAQLAAAQAAAAQAQQQQQPTQNSAQGPEWANVATGLLNGLGGIGGIINLVNEIT